MLENLPPEIRDGLDAARRRTMRRKSRLHLRLGDAVYPLLRFGPEGMALEAALAPRQLRGLVDVHDGPRHVFQCLIVASEIIGDELVCTFKRVTPVSDRPALDYWAGRERPAGHLPAPEEDY